MTRRLTRRHALARALAAASAVAAGAVTAGGCGAPDAPRPPADGSTRRGAYRDPEGTGVLAPGRGEPLSPRTELGATARSTAVLATIAHLTDAHVLDAASPARVTFLDRLGAPFQSTFRPQETLTAQVLAGALYAVRALAPDAVVQGGDLIDNDQANELALALAVLRGGRARPGSGPGGYFGVQSPLDADPFYYRPDLDAPRHPGLLAAAARPFAGPGIGGRWHPVLGDHDILVAGEIAPTPQTRALALGDAALWDLPPGLRLPPGLTSGARGGGADAAGAAAGSTAGTVAGGAGFSPDGPPSPGLVSAFLAQALRGPKVSVPPDPGRRELDAPEVVRALGAAAGVAPRRGRLDYTVAVGSGVRLVVLDLARRAGGSGGLVAPEQPAWLERALAGAGGDWVIVCSHQPLAGAEGGERVLALLDRDPRVLAAIAGHTHRNRIVPRVTARGGYWLIETASLIDYPQQARALRVLATEGGGAAIETWMLDHVLPGRLGTISRQLAYLDAQGGRPHGYAGGPRDRNVTLYRRAVSR